MRPIYYVTVRHTGTRFFLYMLEEAIGEKHHLIETWKDIKSEPYKLAFSHTWPGNYGLITKYITAFNPILIMTERCYGDVVKSWGKRRRHQAELDKWLDVDRQIKEQNNPIILSVDSCDRDSRIAALSEALGYSFITDWKPVGSYKQK